MAGIFLDRLLALNGGGDALMPFHPDEAFHAIFFREAFDEALLVFFHATPEIAGHADIERAIALARQNIDPGPSHTSESAAPGLPAQGRQ